MSERWKRWLGVLGVTIVVWACLLAILSVVAVALYVSEAPSGVPVSYGDVTAVQRSLHDAWLALPTNRPVSAELRGLEAKSTALQNVMAGISWQASPDVIRQKLDEVTKSITEVIDAGKALETSAVKVDASFMTHMLEAEGAMKQLADRLSQEREPDRVALVLRAFGKLFESFGSGLWPLVTLVGVFLLLSKAGEMGGLAGLIGRVQSIKLGSNAEFVFQPNAAPEVGKSANEIFDQYRDRANRTFAELAKQYDLSKRVERVAVDHVKGLVEYGVKAKMPHLTGAALTQEVGARFGSLRFTVHMKDILFEDTLTQVVDYYPPTPGAGRCWSVRYGFIGFTWRSKKSQSMSSVSTNEDNLLREWGMTRDEIRNFVKPKKSLTAIAIGSDPAALFYMDSDIQNVFGIDEDQSAKDDLHEKLLRACDHQALTKAVDDMVRRLDPLRLNIRMSGKKEQA